MFYCYFVSIVYSSIDVFYIINFHEMRWLVLCFFTVYSMLRVHFVRCLLKYLLTYLLKRASTTVVIFYHATCMHSASCDSSMIYSCGTKETVVNQSTQWLYSILALNIGQISLAEFFYCRLMEAAVLESERFHISSFRCTDNSNYIAIFAERVMCLWT